VAAAEPAIFTQDQSGRGQGVILHGEPGVVADTTNPVHAGDAITILCAGLGEVDPPVAPGAAATGDSTALNPVQVMSGGQPAQVDFAGLAIGTPGVYRIATKVPPNTGTGEQIEVVIISAGQTSPPVTMAIQ
jgi:uncharacterized protein (TIGR03437 family)